MLKSAVKEIYTNELHQSLIKMNDIDEIAEILVEKMKEALPLIFKKVNNGEEIDFLGHENKLTEFIKRAENGELFEDMLKEEIDTHKYSMYHVLNGIKKSYEEQLEFDMDWVARILEKQKNKTREEIQEALVFMGKKSLFQDKKCKYCGFNFSRMNQRDASAEFESCALQGVSVKETEINVPSGVLFAADWFRDSGNILKNLTDVENTRVGKEFVKKYEFEAKYGDSAVNELAQVLSAAEVDIATCFVGNSSPIIYEKDNVVVVAEENYDSEDEDNESRKDNMEDFNKKGRICTDLWRCTIIDKQVLENYLLEQYEPSKVQQIIQEFENNSYVVKMNVKPGKYKLTFNVIDPFLPGDENHKYQRYMQLELME